MKARLLALAFGFFLVVGTAYAGPLPGGPDTDGDTVENAFDNCTTVANANQLDTDHNGCGNACTCLRTAGVLTCGVPTTTLLCDKNGDKVVGGPDGLIISDAIVPPPPGSTGDCNGDTVAGGPDLLIFGMEFGNRAGPSGITTAQCNPATCGCTPQ